MKLYYARVLVRSLRCDGLLCANGKTEEKTQQMVKGSISVWCLSWRSSRIRNETIWSREQKKITKWIGCHHPVPFVIFLLSCCQQQVRVMDSVQTLKKRWLAFKWKIASEIVSVSNSSCAKKSWAPHLTCFLRARAQVTTNCWSLKQNLQHFSQDCSVVTSMEWGWNGQLPSERLLWPLTTTMFASFYLAWPLAILPNHISKRVLSATLDDDKPFSGN